MTASNKQIIVLAGPSASGKSHLIDRLLDGKDQTLKTNLFQQLGLPSGLKPGKLNIERLCNAKKMRRRSKKMMKDTYIIHFDLTSRNQRKRREQLKEIASEYKHLAVVTLELTFTTWNQRMSDRVKNKFFGRDEYANSVIVESSENMVGNIVDVIITNFNQNTLFAKLDSSKINNVAA